MITELDNLAQRLVDSWNRGDGRVFAALFTPTAEYVTGAGGHIRGREAISALVDKVASDAQVNVVGQPVVKCDAKSGEVTFMWSGADSGQPRRGRITCSCIRQGSGWLIEALDNNEAGGPSESFDCDDPYAVHAYFWLGFWCTDCGTDLELRIDAEVATDEWCAEAATQARSSRWYVPPASSDGAMDIETCFCPTCTRKRGLTHHLPSNGA